MQTIRSALASAFGRADLPPAMRQHLLTEQIRSIIQMTPAMSVGAAVISLLLLVVTWGDDAFQLVAAWASALALLHLLAFRAWWRSSERTGRRGATGRAIPHAVLNAAILGTLWGLLPVMLLPVDLTSIRLITAVTVTGVLCAAGIGLAAFPAVCAAFTLPVVAGALFSLTRLDSPSEVGAMTFLIVSYVCVMPLISARSAASLVRRLTNESQIREQKDIISLLLKEFEANSSDWLWEFDRQGRIDRVSERFATAAAKPAEALVGHDFCAFLAGSAEENEAIVNGLAQDIERRATFQDVVVRMCLADREAWWRLTGKPAYDEQGEYIGYIGTASDITAERLAERRINFLAHNDALTGLLNRGKFSDHLNQCVARLERYGAPFTLLFLDLDQFKSVNDSRGHMMGDKLLVQVAQRLRTSTREVDLVARLGGDEFAILLNRPCEAPEIAALAQRLVDLVGQPYDFDGDVVSIGVSIGIAMAPINGTRPDQILRNADLALYRAKAAGRGVFRFFESHMDADVRERRMLELELREALSAGELVLHYQPLVATDGNTPSGFEALVRWHHPIRGLIPPAEFIPIAEQTSLINDIGDWTIAEACRAAALWPQPLSVAVNLSAKHFQSSDIAAVVARTLRETGLDPARLELEITESLLIERPDDVIEKLMDVKRLGVSVAMDDFGTGYSSLSYLLKFPFDKIKIDKSFVTASSQDAAARDILRSIASLGKTLKIRITAEGVETQEQVEFLREIACNQLQGFFFAKPLDEAALAGYFLTQFRNAIPLEPAHEKSALALAS